MSFDLYFLSLRPGEAWADVTARLEESALEGAPLDEADLARWDSVRARLAALLPDAETHQAGAYRELTDDVTGIQVAPFHDGLSLGVPYWYSGAEARAMIALLREVVLAIEAETGLTAYDSQAAGEPFIGGGDAAAAQTFDRARDVLESQARLIRDEPR